MRILVFGAGAIGSVFGGFLSQKNDVTLIGRKVHVERINRSGLEVSGIWGDHVFKELKAYTSLSEMGDTEGFDLVMITVKSYDTQGVVERLLPFISGSTAVMSMQNGIGNEETISGLVGPDRTMGGMAIFGARMTGPGSVEVTVYASEVLVGDLKREETLRARMIAETISESGIPAKASDDILRDKWMKAFYNIALNPLSAILKVPYGSLGKSQNTIVIMKKMLEEGFQVAQALKVDLKMGWKEYFDYLMEHQLPPTAGHHSSMLQDIERGRKTEIDYLNGAIVKLGSEKGIPTPVNSTISSIVRSLEDLEQEK